jgi:hypothetical protein
VEVVRVRALRQQPKTSFKVWGSYAETRREKICKK